jgi:hypothetical protein
MPLLVREIQADDLAGVTRLMSAHQCRSGGTRPGLHARV